MLVNAGLKDNMNSHWRSMNNLAMIATKKKHGIASVGGFMTDLLGPEELIADLQHTLHQRHPRPHPVRQLLLTGRLNKEQLQWWARNQFHEFRNIHRFFGVRYQKCPI